MLVFISLLLQFNHIFLERINNEIRTDYEFIKNAIQDLIPKIKEACSNSQSIVGIVGPTGSGKSTLINYLLNAPLICAKVKGGGGKFKILQSNNSEKYPVIGNNGAISCTSIPEIYKIFDEYFVDLTGWGDTRTLNQEIINAYSNSCIFLKGKQVKFIMVVEINSLDTVRGGPFVDMVHRLSEFFQGDMINLINSTILVLSKVNSEWDIESTYQHIQSITNLNDNLSATSKTLLKALRQSNKILFFSNPDNNVHDSIEKIRETITNTRKTTLTQDGNVTISPEADILVQSHISTLNSQLQKTAQQITEEISKNFSKRYYIKGQEVNEDLCKVRKAYSILKNELGKDDVAQNDCKILDDLKQNLDISVNTSVNLSKNIQMIAFYRRIKGDKQQIQLPKLVQTITKQLDCVINKLQARRGELTSAEDRKKMEDDHRVQMIRREKQNQKQIQDFQKRHEASMKQKQEKIQQQRVQFEVQMRQKGKTYAQDMKKMNEQLIRLANRPPQVIHVGGKRKKFLGIF